MCHQSLLEALDALQTRYRYDCNARPVPLPTGEGAASATNKQLLPFFGISAGWAAANGTNTHALLAALTVQWVAHCDAHMDGATSGSGLFAARRERLLDQPAQHLEGVVAATVAGRRDQVGGHPL